MYQQGGREMISKKEVEDNGIDISKIDLVKLMKKDAMTTLEVSKLFGITVPAANAKLKGLIDQGVVIRKKYNNIYHYYAA